MSVILDSPAIKRAKSIQTHVQDVSEDVESQNTDDYCSDLNALVLDCAALAGHWRAVVEHISQQVQCRQDVDLRAAGEILKPTAERTRKVYENIEQQVRNSPCFIPTSDQIDFDLARRELNQWNDWFATWPTWDENPRDMARKECAIEAECTSDDLMTLLGGR
jgi:hypothetical protein